MKLKYKIKSLLKRFGLLDNILYRNYSVYMSNRASIKRFNRDHPLLIKYGPQVLDILFNHDEFKETPIWLEYGTLLGAVRDGRFIPHDIDIDLGLYIDDYTENLKVNLKKNGFVKKHEFNLINHKTGVEYLSEIAYDYHGLNIDFFLACQEGENNRVGYSYYIFDRENPLPNGCYKYKTIRMVTCKALPLETIFLEGVECKAPFNPHSYLKDIYGNSYMTPISGWSPINEKTTREFPEISEYEGRIIQLMH